MKQPGCRFFGKERQRIFLSKPRVETRELDLTLHFCDVVHGATKSLNLRGSQQDSMERGLFGNCPICFFFVIFCDAMVLFSEASVEQVHVM